jgi:hypothetical protein
MKTQWKRRVSQTGLAALMVTMAFGALGSASAAESDTSAQTQVPAVQAQPAVQILPTFVYQQRSSSLLLLPALQRNYLKMLASTYAPETIADWKQALDERKQLESEIPQPEAMKSIVIMKKAGKAADEGNKETGETAPVESKMFMTMPFTKIDPANEAAQSDSSVPSAELKDSLTSDRFQITMTKDGILTKDLTQALPVEGIKASDIIKAEPTEEFKRQQKLAEAVEADDSAAIRSLLPELLKDYKKETETLRTVIKKLQTDVTK